MAQNRPEPAVKIGTECGLYLDILIGIKAGRVLKYTGKNT
jgi:hypothetical protein